MASRIEEYALIGDTETAALVSRDGSIDWFCAPRFDSPACFARLLGDESNGCWALRPAGPVVSTERYYRGDTMVLETLHTTPTGAVAVIDFMPVRGMVMPEADPSDIAASHHGDDADRDRADRRRRVVDTPSIVRVVEGRSGTVTMALSGSIRFDYGGIVPWVRNLGHGLTAVAGADGLVMYSDAHLQAEELRHVAQFEVAKGERRRFSISWFPSHAMAPAAFDVDAALAVTEAWWKRWSGRSGVDRGHEHRDVVMRSLLTMKALTYAPTGGIVAAATTSLPEWIGSVRNWDYRYCWLRDATFTLKTLLDAGYADEAMAWSDWLRRAVAGSPDKMQIMYGVGGERRLDEYEVDWLRGYESSAPVRIGNAASGQFQLDVYGEVMDMFLTVETHQVEHRTALGERGRGLPPDAVDIARFLVDHVRQVWRDPDDGIWEVRGPRRHFVHSKVMAWVAIDRWVQLIDHLGLEDDAEPWRALRQQIHDDVCTQGFDADRTTFTQYYGSTNLDASLLVMALVGFLPPEDERLVGTIEAIQRELVVKGFVLRYQTDAAVPGTASSGDAEPLAGDAVATVDGLPPGEGSFLLTTFWLADALVVIGRVDEARAILHRLLALQNDVGLLSEEYDPDAQRFLGNFPQAFSHIGLVSSVFRLAAAERAAAEQGGGVGGGG